MKYEVEEYSSPNRPAQVVLKADVELPHSRTGKPHAPLVFSKGQTVDVLVEGGVGTGMTAFFYVHGPSGVDLQVPLGAIGQVLTYTSLPVHTAERRHAKTHAPHHRRGPKARKTTRG